MLCPCCGQLPVQYEGRCLYCHCHCPVRPELHGHFQKAFWELLLHLNHLQIGQLQELGLDPVMHRDEADRIRALNVLAEDREARRLFHAHDDE